MRMLIATVGCLVALGACTVVPSVPSSSPDGKCHGPDYNASNCVYLF